MIIVRVELWSARDRSRRELARMVISNDGTTPGSADLRDYDVETLRGRSTAALDRREVQRRGRVLRHASEALHIWHLVGKALKAVGYVKEGE